MILYLLSGHIIAGPDVKPAPVPGAGHLGPEHFQPHPIAGAVHLKVYQTPSALCRACEEKISWLELPQRLQRCTEITVCQLFPIQAGQEFLPTLILAGFFLAERMVSGGAHILEPIAFPAVHDADGREYLLVKVQFKHAGDTPCILQPLLFDAGLDLPRLVCGHHLPVQIQEIVLQMLFDAGALPLKDRLQCVPAIAVQPYLSRIRTGHHTSSSVVAEPPDRNVLRGRAGAAGS